MELLESKLVYDLRDVINKTDIFIKDELEKEKFNLICAVMDRFDSSVDYINKHLSNPKTDDELILLMVHYCIIKDGIKEVCNCLGVEFPITNYFKNIFTELFNISSEDYEGDDKFFEYFRALVFAHPFLTNRAKFIAKGEVHYSPYVITNLGIYGKGNCVGTMVYSNRKDMFNVAIDYDDMKNYIKDKFNVIKLIINSFDEIIKKKEENWKLHRVDRSLQPIDILKDIVKILDERYIESYDVTELVDYLECKTTLKENEHAIANFKKTIINSIPKLCDCVDNMDYDGMYDNIHATIGLRPRHSYSMMHYQLEKIFGYLNDSNYIEYGNKQWGLKQAKEFSKGFASKYVVFDLDNMSYTEIKMLVIIACTEEYKNELKREGEVND